MRAFLRELKRRNVFKVGALYIVVGWLSIQVAGSVLPTFGAPRWVLQTVTFLVLMGFPLALILAWAFEVTPQGIKRSPREDKNMPPAPNSELASVAVLPFKSTEHDYCLAEGIPLELHNSLSRVHNLRVVSAQSAFVHSRADKDLRSLANELGVKYVISGSITALENRIRIIAELYDAVSDTLLWSERFDMEAVEVFEIERQIAEAVAMAFGGERLRLEMSQARRGKQTELAAWELVQRARGYLLEYTPDAVAAAVPVLEKAVKLDPNYAVGFANLGLVTAEKTLNAIGTDAAADRAAAITSIVRAENLAPNDPVVLRSAGAVHAYCGDNSRSLELLRRAVQIAPYDLGAWGYLGWPLVATGRSEDLQEVHAILDRLFAVGGKHPGHAYWLFHKSVAYSCEARFADALDYARQATAEQPKFPLGWMQYANALGALGQSSSAAEAIQRCATMNPRLTPSYYRELMAVLSHNEHVIEHRTAGLDNLGALPAMSPA